MPCSTLISSLWLWPNHFPCVSASLAGSPSLQKWQSFHVLSLSASFPGYFPGGQVSEQAPTSRFFASVEPSEGCSYRNELRKAGRTSWPSPSLIMMSWENGCLFYRRRIVLPWKTESFPEHALPDCQTLTQGSCHDSSLQVTTSTQLHPCPVCRDGNELCPMQCHGSFFCKEIVYTFSPSYELMLLWFFL